MAFEVYIPAMVAASIQPALSAVLIQSPVMNKLSIPVPSVSILY